MPTPPVKTEPEAQIVAWGAQLPVSGTVLDVAAGPGRHTLWFADRGHHVTAIDRDTQTLEERAHPNVQVLTADIENGPWPLNGQRFDIVVVVNYLWRPMLATLIDSVAIGGHMLYATFATGNERLGRPRNPDFLLQPNELRLAVHERFTVLDYSHGEIGNPPSSVRQHLFARREH